MQQKRNSVGSKSSQTTTTAGQVVNIPHLGPIPLDAHHLWFYGYLAFFLAASTYILNTALLRFSFVPSAGVYSLGISALLTSLGITLGKTVKSFSLSLETLDRALQCDSLPYLVLALMLLATPPAPTAVLPLLIYACYHLISFMQNDPKLSRLPQWKQYGEPTALKLLSLQTSAMVLAAHLEVLTMPWLILSFLLARGASLSQIISYAYFLRWQNASSERVKAACQQWDAAITEAIKHPSCPPTIRNAERHIRNTLTTINRQLPSMVSARSRPIVVARKED